MHTASTQKRRHSLNLFFSLLYCRIIFMDHYFHFDPTFGYVCTSTRARLLIQNLSISIRGIRIFNASRHFDLRIYKSKTTASLNVCLNMIYYDYHDVQLLGTMLNNNVSMHNPKLDCRSDCLHQLRPNLCRHSRCISFIHSKLKMPDVCNRGIISK
jgi:hypothetical protein